MLRHVQQQVNMPSFRDEAATADPLADCLAVALVDRYKGQPEAVRVLCSQQSHTIHTEAEMKVCPRGSQQLIAAAAVSHQSATL
jgi:hypothetical protein